MIHTTIGDCYYRINDLQTAEEHFHKALEINPMIGAGYAGLGYVYSDRGYSNKAIRFFEICSSSKQKTGCVSRSF